MDLGDLYRLGLFDKMINTSFGTDSIEALPAFESSIQWDVHALCSELARWMFDDDAQPATTSLVGILSSFSFERLISSSLDTVNLGFGRSLRLFVELSAALYSSGGQASYAGLQSPDLSGLQAYLGDKVLRSLDAALLSAPKNLSLENRKGLFLAVLATIVAVGYSRAWGHIVDVSLLKE